MRHLVIVLIFTAGLVAGPVDNLEKEFSQIEEHYKQDAPSDEDKKKILEKNLVSAVRLSLNRRYLDFEEKTKNLKAETISYQLIEESFSCYVKYENYYIFYKYYKDPRTYYQTPVIEKFFVKPGNMTQVHEAEKKN